MKSMRLQSHHVESGRPEKYSSALHDRGSHYGFIFSSIFFPFALPANEIPLNMSSILLNVNIFCRKTF